MSCPRADYLASGGALTELSLLSHFKLLVSAVMMVEILCSASFAGLLSLVRLNNCMADMGAIRTLTLCFGRLNTTRILPCKQNYEALLDYVQRRSRRTSCTRDRAARIIPEITPFAAFYKVPTNIHQYAGQH